VDYLTERPQFVRLGGCTSDTVLCSTGAPQGTVLFPVLFTLYTSDFQHEPELCHMQKYSDDTAIVGCIADGQETEYRAWWRTLWDGAGLTTCSLTPPRQRRWWWTSGGGDPISSPFPSRALTWRWSGPISTCWDCSWMTNWTGLLTQRASTPKGRVVFTS